MFSFSNTVHLEAIEYLHSKRVKRIPQDKLKPIGVGHHHYKQGVRNPRRQSNNQNGHPSPNGQQHSDIQEESGGTQPNGEHTVSPGKQAGTQNPTHLSPNSSPSRRSDAMTISTPTQSGSDTSPAFKTDSLAVSAALSVKKQQLWKEAHNKGKQNKSPTNSPSPNERLETSAVSSPVTPPSACVTPHSQPTTPEGERGFGRGLVLKKSPLVVGIGRGGVLISSPSASSSSSGSSSPIKGQLGVKMSPTGASPVMGRGRLLAMNLGMLPTGISPLAAGNKHTSSDDDTKDDDVRDDAIASALHSSNKSARQDSHVFMSPLDRTPADLDLDLTDLGPDVRVKVKKNEKDLSDIKEVFETTPVKKSPQANLDDSVTLDDSWYDSDTEGEDEDEDEDEEAGKEIVLDTPQQEQFNYVISGAVNIQADGGENFTFHRGEFYLLPKGFKGTLKTLGHGLFRYLKVTKSSNMLN